VVCLIACFVACLFGLMVVFGFVFVLV